MNIKRLPDEIVKKIAAGQVVERPASVIKELIENAIDAKSQNIKIEVLDGGISLIKVSDDGYGMSEGDLVEAYKLHTTSKIFDETDLYSISTLGFRGEALASIASVSFLNIRSRVENELSGTEVEIENGNLVNKTSIGMPVGTVVEVKNLFYNTPARKKFLKSPATEFRYIADMVVSFALAHPEIGFFLAHNQRISLDLPAGQTVSERISSLLAKDLNSQLLPVSFEDTHFAISGFITKPQAAGPIKTDQYLFVNRRPVSDKLISDAVKDAYGTLLMPRNHPKFVLFFELPASMVDVNIHPRKETLAFSDSEFVYELFKKAVSQVFKTEEVMYKFGDAGQIDLLRESAEEYTTLEENAEISQLHKLYLVKQVKDGVLLIDQHASHERILYEKLLTQFEQENVEVKELDEPVIFSLSLSDSTALEEHLGSFGMVGFEIELFGNETFKISKIPWFVKENNILEIIEEILEDLKQGKGIKNLDSKTHHLISTMACKSAIKSGDYLSLEERKKLLEDLEETKTQYTCPHGRPVKLELTLNELARMFKRK